MMTNIYSQIIKKTAETAKKIGLQEADHPDEILYIVEFSDSKRVCGLITLSYLFLITTDKEVFRQYKGEEFIKKFILKPKKIEGQ